MAGFSDRSPRLVSPQVGSRTLDPEPWRGYGGMEEEKSGRRGKGNGRGSEQG